MHRTWFSLWTLLSLFVNLLAPAGISAASLPQTEYATRDIPLLPAWFTLDSARASGPTEVLPAWFAPPADHGVQAPDDAPQVTGLAPRGDLLPAWFAPPADHGVQAPDDAPQVTGLAPRGDLLPAWFAPRPLQDTPTSPSVHHTIYDVTVIGPDAPVNNCDVVTFTVVAANDAVTTTGVIITSTMPAGFTPTQIVFNVGEVAPNEVITRHAVFSATCDAVSGQNVVTLTQDGAAPIVRYTDFIVNPGAITVRKEPAVIPAGLDDVVTWTIYVENTGYGTVSNVRVTDTLGSGLEYVSGVTSTFYVSLAVGEMVTFPISARVVGCSGLENEVVATWGCNGQTCQTPQTAKGAVDLVMRNPDLAFTLPSFNVPYCAGSGVFTIPVTNTGDAIAHSGTLAVDLAPFSVTVAPPATYDGSAFHLPEIPPGETYNLVFTLTLPSAVCTMPRRGTFNFDLGYRDRCGSLYTELPQSTSWQLVDAPGQLDVTKSMPGEVYRGQNVTATVTVNASGITGTIVVTDQVPAGWSVVDAAGGVTFTVGGVTYITWTLSGSDTLNPVFATPDAATGCAYCGTIATNIVTATASDCQNCLQTATASASTYLQCEEPVATTFKEVSGPAEVCSDPAFVYTNTYAFAGSFIVTPTWQGMVFTDVLPYQTYITGSASVWMSDGSITCTAAFSEAVVGGSLVISNISPTCPITVPGATMWISYTAAVTEPSACSDFEFYDWSVLNVGVTGNAECAADGVIEEGVFVRTLAPAMTLSPSGLPPYVSSCGVYTVTLTARRTSAVPAYDAVIDVPTTTFYVLDVLGFSGATPVYTETDGGGYHWYYSDTFATAITGTIDLRVQLRCGSGAAPFQGTLYYDNLCANNETYRERCSAGGTLDVPPVIGPLPIMTKFPEVIHAQGDVVTWTLTAYNSGAGPAYSVVLTDALGSGLRYVDSSITSTMGSVAGVTPITSSNLVTWTLPVIQPKERVTIQYVAEIIGCTDLTNRFAGAQGCLGQTCQSGGPVQSHVELPPTVLLNTNQAVTPIDTCYTRTVTVTVRNAGLMSVYSATLTETLPTGLSYVIGTTEVSTDTVNWQTGPDPTINGGQLIWGPGSGAPLDTLLSRIRPGETVYLRFAVYASCPFGGGQLRIQTGYYDTCGTPHLTEASYFVMPVRQADLTLVKAGQNLSRTSPSSALIYAEPGEPVVFTLTVSNASSAAPAREVVVTDTLPGNVVFQDATPGYSGPTGGVITWTIPLINPGGSVVLTVTTVVSQPEGCTVTDTVNTAQVAWGCPDGCRESLPPVRVTLRSRPVFALPVITTDIPPATLNRCGGEITITLNNEGPPAYNVILTDTLPSGYVYSDTVYASTQPSSTTDLGQTVVYTWGVLPTGLTTITLAVRNSVGAGGCATPSGPNVITMTYDDDVPDCLTTGPYSATASADITVVGPTFWVYKTPHELTAQLGQRVTWTVRILNVGYGTAYNVVVTDEVGSSFVGVTATNGSDGSPPVVVGNVVTWTPSPIPGYNGEWTAQVSAVLTDTGDNGNFFIATASCDTGCLATSASDSAYVSLMEQFDKGPAVQTGTIGSLAVFTFTAFLPDTDNIYESFSLADTLPTGLGYVSSVLSYTYDGDGDAGGPTTVVTDTPTITPGYLASGDVVWNLGDLPGTVQVDGVITAVIRNIPSNRDGVRLTNTLGMTYTENGQEYVYTDTAVVDIVEPSLDISKDVESSTGSLTNLDGTAYLTYTIRLTNTGSSPAYDVVITDAIPQGISVTALYGGDSRSAPVQGPGVLTWTVAVMSDTLPGTNNPLVLTYTARITGALPGAALVNVVSSTYSSLPGEPFPGQERDYGPITDTETLTTTSLVVSKATEPPVLRVGDIVTYHLVFTVPAGTVGMGDNSFLRDALPPGIWYITDSETLTWTPAGVVVTFTARSSGTLGSAQVITWTFGDPITSTQDEPTVITLTFRAQATGIDALAHPVWTPYGITHTVTNTVELWQRSTFIGDDSASNQVIQPSLSIDKNSTPPPGSYVGAGDLVTYTLTVTNSGHGPAYDWVISDVLPAGLFYVTSTISSTAPPTVAFTAEPAVGATGVLTWRVNELWGRYWNSDQPGVAVVTVVAQVTDTIGANLLLTNTAAIPYYDSQPGDGPGPYPPDEREYTDGSDSVWHRTVDAAISKTVTFAPPPTATLGTLVTYTLIVPATPISATLYNVVVTDTIDSRLRIEGMTVSGGTGWSWGWVGQVAMATFASIPHDTQAYITVTARISHEWPSPANDANAGDVITDVAQMSHATAPVTVSNQVSTTVGEPNLLLDKSVESSSGSLDNLDGTAYLTYTIRLTNTGSSPAYSVYITDAVPAGISVTAQYGGDNRSGPVVGPGVLTWTVDYISNTAPANVAVLTYTARISQALADAWLTNTVDVLYHSLTDTIPGVRPYTGTDQAAVETAPPDVAKSTEPPVLRVGDIVTYHIVFTIPEGTIWSGNTLVDGLTPGLWYITDSETLTWTPPTVNVTVTNRTSTTTEVPGSQVIRWYFAPITSEQDIPTVVTLTFQAQAVGLRIDTLEPVWTTQTDFYWPGNYVQLEYPWPDVVTDVVTNLLIQPFLSIDKNSTPPPGASVGAGDRITYTLTVTNSGYGPAYDWVISDVLPAGLFYVTSTITSSAPPTVAFTAEPAVGATGVLTWRVNELWGRYWNGDQPGVAVVTVVAQVTDTIGANLLLTNTAAIPYYDSQPGDGPGPYPPDEREYTDGSDSVSHRTVDAAVLKTVSPPTATLGDVVTYVIVVPATPITATLYNVTVTDGLDARLQLYTVADGPDGTVSAAGNAFTVTYASIPHGQQRYITVTAVLSDPLGAVAGDVITNLAVLAHQDGGPTPSNRPPFTVTEPSLTLVKASDPPTSSTVGAGDPVTYTVTITNWDGPNASAAYDVVFTDTLPAGMRDAAPVLLTVTLNGAPVAPTDYVTGYNSATGLFTVTFTPAFSVPVGGALVIRYVATVDSDVPAATDLTNRAEATWSSLPGPVPGDRDYGPITDTTTLHTPLATGLSKSVSPPTVTVGSQVVFTVVLPVPPVGAVLHNVVFTDVVDGRLRIDAVSPNAAFSGQVVTATFTTIPTYTQEVIVITATVRDLVTVTAGTQITNVATFDYQNNPAGPRDSNVVTVTVAEPHVTLDKSVQTPRDPLGAGDIVTYSLVLSNTGGWPAYDLVVTDALPSGLSFVATVGFTVTDPTTATLGGNYPAWTVSQLNVGGYVFITFTAQVAPDIGAGLTLTNAAWGRYDGQPGPNPDQREYPIPTDTVPVNTGYPALDLEKSAAPSPVEAGGLLTYTLTVTNTGIVSATGVVITDAVPANTTYLSCGPLPCGEAGGIVSWTLGTLDIGTPRVVTMLVQVDSPLPNGTILTNTAWVTSTEGITDTDEVTTPVTSAPVLNLVKFSTDADGPPLRPGDRLTYTLVVSNTGNETATGVTVRDTVPAHTTYVPGSIAGGDSQDDTGLPVLVWTINVLAPNVPVSLTFAVTVNIPLTDGLPIVNTGAVTCTQVPTPTTGTVTDTVTSSHLLTVTKTASPSPVEAGDLLTYTIAYTVTGDEPVYGVTVSDTVPANTTFVTATLPHVLAGDTVVWPLGDLLPPESGITQATGTLTMVVRVNTPLVSGTLIYNGVAISDTSGLTDTDEVTTPVQSRHSLSVTKTASPSPVQAGELLTYTIAWAVSGNEPAFDVTLSDTVPASTAYQSCSGGLSCGQAGGVVTWSLGDQYPPASGVVTLVVLVDSPLVSGTVLSNGVAITDTSGLTDTDEVTTPVQSRHSLSVTKTASPSPVQAGELLTYTIAWQVSGNEPAFDVTLSDTVPASTTYQACSGAPCGESGGIVTWSLGDQYPPASGVVTLVVLVDSPLVSGTVLSNGVAITDTSGLTDTDEVTTLVQSRHSLSVTKTASPSPVQAGALLTYTIAWQVGGNEPAFDVTLSDTVPASTTYQACSGAPCGESGGIVTWSLGDQYPPASGVVTLVVRVNSDVPAGALILNAVIITDTSGITDTDDITTPVETAADLAVVKADDPDPVIVGTLLTYTLVVTNNGPSDAANVVVTDTLPPEVAFVSAVPVQDSGPNPLVWSLGNLAAGQVRYLTVTVRVLVTTTDVFTNAVAVGSDTPDDNPGNNGDEEPTTPLVPGLELTKDVAPGQAVRSMPFTYTIRITNTGQVTFDPLVLTDTMPTDFHYVVGSGDPRDPDVIAEPLLVWQNLGPLAPGASITVSFAVTATPGITGTYWNVALAEGTTPGGVLTDTDDAPVVIADPAIALDKQLVAADLDDVFPNYVTFTIVITNVGVSTIDVLPLVDQYDPYYLSFVTAEPYPEEDADDGLLTWYDLTGPAPNGFGRDLAPGESFQVTTVFSVVHDITTTVNTAIVEGPYDIYDNPANEPRDDEPIVNIPTAVELLYFRVGSVTGRSVRLKWETAVEIDNFGFRLYRAPVEDFSRAKGIAFVPSAAWGGGATYAYTDTVPTDGTWWYWLADVDTSGRETSLHGPVSAMAMVGAALLPYRVYLPLVLR